MSIDEFFLKDETVEEIKDIVLDELERRGLSVKFEYFEQREYEYSDDPNFHHLHLRTEPLEIYHPVFKKQWLETGNCWVSKRKDGKVQVNISAKFRATYFKYNPKLIKGNMTEIFDKKFFESNLFFLMIDVINDTIIDIKFHSRTEKE